MNLTDLPLGFADLIAERLGLSARGPFQSNLIPALTKLAVSLDVERDQLAAILKAQPITTDAWQRVIDALTIGETRFLRQRTWFDQIWRVILAPLIARRAAGDRKQLRIWCAGCSTGEEPYTVAMLLRGRIADLEAWDISILATDIRRSAIITATGGEYGAHQFRELDGDLMGTFFNSVGHRRYSVAAELRQMVRFELGNLAETQAASHHYDTGPYDLIICRNVLMYMIPEAQRRIAARLRDAVSDAGWIAVSPAEAIAEWFRPLEPINGGEAILFSKRELGSPRVMMPRDPKGIDLPLRQVMPEVRLEQIPSVPTKRVSSSSQQSISLDRIRSIADAGRLNEAAALCRAAMKADILDGETAILLAAIFTEVGDFPAALESARRAVYLEPSSVMGLNLLAGALLNLGHTERARRTFAAAERLAETLAGGMPSDHIEKSSSASVSEVGHAGGV